MTRGPRRCPHCHGRAGRVHCVTCNREMCEDCVSYGEAGPACGLCRDREEASSRYALYKAGGGLLAFDDWYDGGGG
jgi:hypothetical protein